MSRNIDIRVNYKKTVPVESKNKSYINMSNYITIFIDPCYRS
jgi:hypothetical protein